MKRTILQGGLVAVALAAVAVSCSNKPETQLTPSGVTETATFANPDGSTVKANAPTGLSPNGGTLDTRRPTLSFTNASGRFVTIAFCVRARTPGRRRRRRLQPDHRPVRGHQLAHR